MGLLKCFCLFQLQTHSFACTVFSSQKLKRHMTLACYNWLEVSVPSLCRCKESNEFADSANLCLHYELLYFRLLMTHLEREKAHLSAQMVDTKNYPIKSDVSTQRHKAWKWYENIRISVDFFSAYIFMCHIQFVPNVRKKIEIGSFEPCSAKVT